ncbi:uncharacterized protein EDB93DRAFT_1249272 [Suillus bovinus]|uniref:uncharacterized protein n=1 Tax=Suillus bovinus TaxID=48563 RepID=UPI001B87CCCB|nr:uncharacterized protein EDB93DRAFT_1249272 [Suillus bovinus]KAG2151626.1 hypothetical protein EDB93DRAFT_1249272 [Suillus bovinus]
MDGNMPILYHEHITPERECHSQREHDRVNCLQMTSPTRRNRRHAAHDRPAPHPPPHFPYEPLPVGQYPGLPRNAIAHVQRAHQHPPVDYNACLNEQMNAAHNDRRRQRNRRRQQDREEIREQAQAELMAAGMQPMQVPQVHNEPAQPAPAPPVYGAIHYEGAVGPHNFDNPLHYFAPNPALPLHGPPEPDYHQFNIQFQHHLQAEQMDNERIRNDLLQRQAQEEFRRRQIQLQLQQQEAERINREAQWRHEEALCLQQEAERIQRQAQLQYQEALHLQQQEAERFQRQAQLQQQEDLCLQQEEAERIQRQAHLQQQEEEQQNRLAQDRVQAGRQEEEQHNRRTQDRMRAGQEEEEIQHQRQQRIRKQAEHLEEVLHEYNDPASQENHAADEERRRAQEIQQHEEREAEDQPINIHSLGPLNVECTKCHALHFASERLLKSSLRNPKFGTCCLEGKVVLLPFPPWPPELQRAYTDRTFVSKIRQYNSALAFTSVGVDIEDRALQGSGPNAFHIHGSLHHLMGSLIPPEGIQPSYVQLYIYNPEEATNICATRPGNEGLDRGILRELHDMLY